MDTYLVYPSKSVGSMIQRLSKYLSASDVLKFESRLNQEDDKYFVIWSLLDKKNCTENFKQILYDKSLNIIQNSTSESPKLPLLSLLPAALKILENLQLKESEYHVLLSLWDRLAECECFIISSEWTRDLTVALSKLSIQVTKNMKNEERAQILNKINSVSIRNSRDPTYLYMNFDLILALIGDAKSFPSITKDLLQSILNATASESLLDFKLILNLDKTEHLSRIINFRSYRDENSNPAVSNKLQCVRSIKYLCHECDIKVVDDDKLSQSKVNPKELTEAQSILENTIGKITAIQSSCKKEPVNKMLGLLVQNLKCLANNM